MTEWAHSPSHKVGPRGAYMVTAATLYKAPLFNYRAKLDILAEKLFEVAEHRGAKLQAWAIFSNHYHFVACFDVEPNLASMTRELHANSARIVNEMDGKPRRKVWIQYWDSHITFQRSYFARLNYVHRNAVRHGVVREAANYPWCSAGWFERSAKRAFQKTIWAFRDVKLRIDDDYKVPPIPNAD